MAPHELIRHWENEDLRAFGLVPKFVGRFSTISTLSDLTSAELAELVDSVEGTPLREEQGRYQLHGIRLEFKISDFFAAARRCETDLVRALMHFLALERSAGKEDG